MDVGVVDTVAGVGVGATEQPGAGSLQKRESNAEGLDLNESAADLRRVSATADIKDQQDGRSRPLAREGATARKQSLGRAIPEPPPSTAASKERESQDMQAELPILESVVGQDGAGLLQATFGEVLSAESIARSLSMISAISGADHDIAMEPDADLSGLSRTRAPRSGVTAGLQLD